MTAAQLEFGAGAELSLDQKHRFRLWRSTGAPSPLVCLFIMLNPSTADAVDTDATVRRCRDYARRWGYGEVRIVNLFTYRTKSPRVLYSVLDGEPLGRSGEGRPGLHVTADSVLLEEARRAHLVVAAWGAHGLICERDRYVLRLLEAAAVPVFALKLTKEGAPWHPVRLPKNLQPFRWLPPRNARSIPRRALSLHQPWAWLLSAGIKPIENRDWNTHVRGRFLVHASKAMTMKEYEDCREFSRFAIDPSQFPPPEAFARGGIVGAVTLTDVLPPVDYAEPQTWRMDGAYGLVCEEPQVLPFVECRGGRRWFNVDDATLTRLWARSEGA